jgi:hypothetical protein
MLNRMIGYRVNLRIPKSICILYLKCDYFHFSGETMLNRMIGYRVNLRIPKSICILYLKCDYCHFSGETMSTKLLQVFNYSLLGSIV